MCEVCDLDKYKEQFGDEVVNKYHLKDVDWQNDSDYVYIGRILKNGVDVSLWGNPFEMDKKKSPEDKRIERKRVVNLYREYLWGMIKAGKITIDDLISLDNKKLVCYCSPSPCHGHVLKAAVEWAIKH